MIRYLLFSTLFFIFSDVHGQRHLYLGWQTGGINYQGEMQDISFSFTGMHLAMGGGIMLQLDDHWMVGSEFIRAICRARTRN